MGEMIATAKKLMEKKENFVLARVVETVGSTPRKKGAWLIMSISGETYGTVGGGKLEALVEEICKRTFQTREDKIYEFSLTPEEQNGIDMRCGGDAKVHIEYIDQDKTPIFEEMDATSTAIIFGAGHVGKEIGKILRYVDFATIILDDRPEFANEIRFPDAEKIIVLDDFNQSFDQISTDANSYIIIVTRGHSGDYIVLKQALLKEYAYIGMIGSKKKTAAIYDQLKQDGFTEQDLEKIHAPIGLEIGAETPEEIAISIAGEMIKIRAER